MSHRPLGVWQVASAGCSIPGTVRVSSKAAFSTGLPIHTATVKGNLGNACVWSQIQLLLWRHRVVDYDLRKILSRLCLDFQLFKWDQLLCRVKILHFVMHSTQDELKPGWALLQKFITKVKQHFDILLCPFCKRKLHPLPIELVCNKPSCFCFLVQSPRILCFMFSAC